MSCPPSRERFHRHLLTGFIVAVALATVHSQSSEQQVGPRTIVTTDPELDDSNSLVRFLLYAGEVETEGLIYASSQFHWRGDGKGTLFSMPDREYSRGGAPKMYLGLFYAHNKPTLHFALEFE